MEHVEATVKGEGMRVEEGIVREYFSGKMFAHAGRAVARVALAMLLVLSLGAVAAYASGPRWVTGPPYFTGPPGLPVVWQNEQPLYFTDAGDLSAWVDHATADAIVASAAGVWNVPTANITLAYGGALKEHVSGANTYLGSGGIVFPADARSSNYAAVQIAVIYDSDGSVTDMLLGGGASSPAECLQNGVTESVDSITPTGFIQHAVLVLNGRCTGPAPEQQLQMQYQLERAFGRILGLGWSQTNDNVFTQTPQPTYVQAQHWPIMHPIDIVCGEYTYQCLPQPFTLRDDDVAGLSSLYLIGYSNLLGWTGFWPTLSGKQASYGRAAHAYGYINFPNGQGMNGVNVVAQRREMFWDTPDAFYDTSSVSGFLYQQDGPNPVTGAGTSLAASQGTATGHWNGNYGAGYYDLSWIPLIVGESWDFQNWVDVYITTEPLNPLYTGTHAVGPYGTGQVEPSGSSMTQFVTGLYPNVAGYDAAEVDFTAQDAASSCATGADGVESAPAPVAAGGWWTGLLCAHGHTPWASFKSQAGRTATVEVTALDESGYATTAKAMPLIGIWGANDATGTLPTVGYTPSPFNTTTVGMTGISVATQAGGFRLAITDARGDGRPDFSFQARVLYADSVQPAATSVNGGLITISGMGFRTGNEVLVNGVVAEVASWTATSIVAVAPPINAWAGPVNVEVLDLSTGGSTVISGALTYGGVAPDEMKLVSAPSGTVLAGVAAAVPFAVRVVLGDGVTPVVGLPVAFSASGGAVQFGGCVGSPCLAVTDATGLAFVTVTPTAFGTVTLQAAAVGATQTATFNAVTESVSLMRVTEYVAADVPAMAWSPQVMLLENGAPAVGVTVNWTGSGGIAFALPSTVANGQGLAQADGMVGTLAAGAPAAGQACAWGGSGVSLGPVVCAAFSVVAVDPPNWRVKVVSGAGQAIGLTETFAPVNVMVTDTAGHPIAGAPVTIHQTVDQAAMACPARGACPVPPVLGGSDAAGVSDENGLVTVTPMQIPGVGEVTNIAVAAGTLGFVSLSIAQGH
jgi:hypothetical protein